MVVCPGNFFCFNQSTFMLITVAVIVVVIFYINSNNYKFNELTNNLNKNRDVLENKISTLINIETPIVTDPRLVPPLRKLSIDMNKPGIPINIKTRGEPTGYQQIGVLIDGSGADPKLLALYGQETYPNSKVWNYYTSSDGFQSVKLSVVKGNKNCQEHYGCKEIMDGEDVSVKGYSNTFKVNVYKLQTARYIPHVL